MDAATLRAVVTKVLRVPDQDLDDLRYILCVGWDGPIHSALSKGWDGVGAALLSDGEPPTRGAFLEAAKKEDVGLPRQMLQLAPELRKHAQEAIEHAQLILCCCRWERKDEPFAAREAIMASLQRVAAGLPYDAAPA